MLDVEFYRLYNGLWARDLMLFLCCDFAMIFAIFTKVCCVFKTIFCCDFLLSLPTCLECLQLLSIIHLLGTVENYVG